MSSVTTGTAASRTLRRTGFGAFGALLGRPGSRTAVYYRDLLWVLVGKEFKIRYKSTVLGYAWSVMHPLAFAMVFFALFSIVMRFEMNAYVLFLLAGLFPWQAITNSIGSSSFYFLGNSSLIKKVRFHRATLVLAGVSMELLHLIASVPIIIVLMLYFGRPVDLLGVFGRAPWQLGVLSTFEAGQRTLGLWLWALPALLLLQMALTFGISLFIATCNLFLRDLERLTRIVMHLLFYMTPVLYPLSKVPEQYHWVLYANPFAPIIVCWKGLIYYGRIPLHFLLLSGGWAVLSVLIGYAVYHWNVRRFAEVV